MSHRCKGFTITYVQGTNQTMWLRKSTSQGLVSWKSWKQTRDDLSGERGKGDPADRTREEGKPSRRPGAARSCKSPGVAHKLRDGLTPSLSLTRASANMAAGQMWPHLFCKFSFTRAHALSPLLCGLGLLRPGQTG